MGTQCTPNFCVIVSYTSFFTDTSGSFDKHIVHLSFVSFTIFSVRSVGIIIKFSAVSKIPNVDPDVLSVIPSCVCV